MREVIPSPVPGLDLRREYGRHQGPAIRAGGMVFCSGMVAIDPENGERQHGTVTSEARRIFENLKLLLESTGLSLDPPGEGARNDLRPHRVRRAQPPLPTVCPECAAGSSSSFRFSKMRRASLVTVPC